MICYISLIPNIICHRLPQQPRGLAYDSKSGLLLVALSQIGHVPDIIAMDVAASAVVRTMGMERSAKVSQLGLPRDVALDAHGNMLVVFPWEDLIGVFDASSGALITTFPTPPRMWSVFVDTKNDRVVYGGDDHLCVVSASECGCENITQEGAWPECRRKR